MKQTAVEWLIEKLEKRGYIFEKKEDIIIDQTKEMEKQQITKAYNSAVPFKFGEQYYNETFKQ